MELPDADSLIDEQIAYYRARAPEYDNWWLRIGRYDQGDEFAERWEAGKAALVEALVRFAPQGDVLELAAGTGNLTVQLSPLARRVTAVDASAETLAIAAAKLDGATNVTFVQADLFDWQPPRRYDAVVFGFWLSHVPPSRLAAFWQLVDAALVPDGRVFFVDNALPVEQAASTGGRVDGMPWSHTRLDEGVSERELADGRRFRIVKRAWTPAELEAELAELGWRAMVEETHGLFIHGTAGRARR